MVQKPRPRRRAHADDEGRRVADLADIGVLGLAVMGANLARNAARKGFGVALYQSPSRPHRRAGARAWRRRAGSSRRRRCADFVAAIRKPRAIIVMVKAGKPVDDVIDELLPHLEPGDILIDGGNSQFTDTNRRFAELKDTGIRFIGMGVSGGEEGALNGPSMMPGGELESYQRIEPIVTKDGGAGGWHALRRPSSARKAPATT